MYGSRCFKVTKRCSFKVTTFMYGSTLSLILIADIFQT